MPRERLLASNKVSALNLFEEKLGLNGGPRSIPGYHQDFLKTEEAEGKGEKDEYKQSGSQQYLESCSHSVDLGMLYEMQEEIGTCAHNEQMEYTPVQVKVNEKSSNGELKRLHNA